MVFRSILEKYLLEKMSLEFNFAYKKELFGGFFQVFEFQNNSRIITGQLFEFQNNEKNKIIEYSNFRIVTKTNY